MREGKPGYAAEHQEKRSAGSRKPIGVCCMQKMRRKQGDSARRSRLELWR